MNEIPVPPVIDVLKVLELNFNERSYEDKYMSQDNIHFVQLLWDIIKQRKDKMRLSFKDCNPPALPKNKRLAMVRLQHLKKKLKAKIQYSIMSITRRGDAEPTPQVQ